MENGWKIHEKLSKNDWLSLKCDSNLAFEMWIVTQNQLLSGEWSNWMNLWWLIHRRVAPVSNHDSICRGCSNGAIPPDASILLPPIWKTPEISLCNDLTRSLNKFPRISYPSQMGGISRRTVVFKSQIAVESCGNQGPTEVTTCQVVWQLCLNTHFC